MHDKHFPGEWLSYAVWALLSGAVLWIVGIWCLESANIPPPTLALPLPQRFLAGLSFMLLTPFTLIPLTLILTASRFLASKASWGLSVVVTLVGITFLLVGAFWVPNPIVLWPITILGEHTLRDLIGELFTFHIVPSPGLSLSTDAGIQSLIRWQIEECGARFSILMIAWTTCLAPIWRIHTRLISAKSLQPKPAAPGS